VRSQRDHPRRDLAATAAGDDKTEASCGGELQRDGVMNLEDRWRVHGAAPMRLLPERALVAGFWPMRRGACSGGMRDDQMRSNAETAVALQRRRAAFMVAIFVIGRRYNVSPPVTQGRRGRALVNSTRRTSASQRVSIQEHM
jgi:hypothetical protein